MLPRRPRASLLLLFASLAGALRPQLCRSHRPALRHRTAAVRCVEDDEFRGGLADSWSASGREDDLAADIARLKAENAAKMAEAGIDPDEVTLLDRTINTLGTVLTYNFFIIITFFGWFLTGCFSQFALKQFVIINAFRGAWDPLIMPLLTTHMTLTFLSYGLEKVAGRDPEIKI